MGWSEYSSALITGAGIGSMYGLTALLPDNAPADSVVQIAGWNIALQTITPTAAIAAQ